MNKGSFSVTCERFSSIVIKLNHVPCKQRFINRIVFVPHNRDKKHVFYQLDPITSVNISITGWSQDFVYPLPYMSSGSSLKFAVKFLKIALI